MKKKKNNLVVLLTALIAILSFSFSSCTKDQEIGMDLTRCWDGNLYGVSTWNGQTYRIQHTTIRFWADAFKIRTGYGKWVDFYSDRGTPWGTYYASNFNWTVEDQCIYITFNDGSRLRIREYRLNSRVFDGYLDEYSRKEGKYIELDTSFSLDAVNSENEPNWNHYSYDRNYYTWNTLGAPTRAAESDTTEIQLYPERHYNVFSE